MQGVSLIDIFEGAVAKSGQSTCVCLEDGRTYSYQQVDEIATCIGKELACAVESAAINEDDSETPLVAVMMTRGIGLVSAILGILKAGAAYVPVDPAFPPDRQTHIFAHSKCKMLITDEESLELALSLGVIVPPTLVINSAIPLVDADITVSTIVKRTLHLPAFNNLNKVAILSIAREKVSNREDGGLAYVLYTSGSTGKPKGVMLKQAGVVNIVNWFADELNLDSNSRVLGLTTFCFDISVLEMFLPLFRGASLVMVNQSSQKDPFHLLDVVRDCAVTVIQATPTTFEMLFATGWTGDTSIDFLVGGEAFRASILPLAKSSRSLRNVYGPTETTIWSSSYTLPKDVSTLQYSNGVPLIPIGMPISETVFYIVSEDEILPKTIMPSDKEGELWIGGVGVAKGYLNAPELTKEKFFRNPFGPGSVYRTGDIVTRLEGGQGKYIFVRRMDDQVKIDGFRIELAEIETVFSSHNLVEKTVAVVKDGKLALYIKGVTSVTLSKAQIKEIQIHAGRSLTYYMMPKSIVQMSVFPETANGKLDRKALPDPTVSDLCVGELDATSDLNSEVLDENNVLKEEEEEGEKDEEEERERMNSKIDVDEHTTLSSYPNIQSKSELEESPGYVRLKSSESTDPRSVRNINKSKLKNTKAVTIMMRHVCDMIEELRGRRPSTNSSFASIGVDSLGAVMFIKYLSDSLGGIRLEPAKIYAPGVTIRSFSESLLTRLEKEKPEALINLGITDRIDAQDSQFDLESGSSKPFLGKYGEIVNQNEDQNSIPNTNESTAYDCEVMGEGEEEGGEMFKGAGDLQKLENSFEDLLATNRALIEGVRGIFTFLVLYDHFHNPHNAISSSFSADTYLFVMISGFTTALQLRETAQFVHVEPDDVCEIQLNPILNDDTQNTHNNQNNNSNNHSHNDHNSAMDSPRNERNGREADIGRVRKSSITEDSQGLFTSTSPTVGRAEWFSVSVKGGTGPAGLKLLPRKSFNIRSFIVSRCVGLYPILWVALLLNIPPWMNVHVNDDKVNNTQKAVCSVLYVIGMQSWYRPTCHLYGPNNLLYASIILNCFILYGIGRMILMTLQNHLMTYASEELSPLTLRPPRRIRRSRTWKQWVGDKAVLLAYNRTDMSTMLVMVSFWILVVLGLFTFMLYNTFAKNAFTFIAYFVAGAIAACVLENVHFAFWHWGRSHDGEMEGLRAIGVIDFAYRVYNHTDTKPVWPWVHRNWLLSYFYPSASISEMVNIEHNSPILATYSPLRGTSRKMSESLDNSSNGSRGPSLSGDETDNHPQRDSTFFTLCCYIWRFFPDFTAIGIGFLMSTLGDLNKEEIKFVLWFVIVPFAFLILILVSMLQTGSARYNYSRFFLESLPITTLGYTSYAMYLFQRIMLTCWLPFFYYGIKDGHFDLVREGVNNWFETLPTIAKFFAVFFLTLLCYFVHRYFQDFFVTYWYAYIVSKI